LILVSLVVLKEAPGVGAGSFIVGGARIAIEASKCLSPHPI
jgi:hypothetical protein